VTVPFSYLPQQFANTAPIFDKIKDVIARGDFTLGGALAEFETAFAARCGVPHAIGVNSGTDALFLALKALNIKGEVITTPFTFYATVASIANAGAKPVFADVGNDFNIDPAAIAAAITPRTEAIMPVHWAGRPCNMTAICDIAARHGLEVIEDAAQAFGSIWDGKPCGSWGDAAGFSLHPLKTLNVWGDGGVAVTEDETVATRLRQLRNHGLADRDTCVEWGYNSRLDTIQAVVAHHVLGAFSQTLAARVRNARRLDGVLADIGDIRIEPMHPKAQSNYYLYTFQADARDDLVQHLNANGVEAKVHYPIPVHLQPAAASLKHKRGAFPQAEECARTAVSLPAHEYVSGSDIERMAELIAGFYSGAKSAAA
jgi:dTDP-4-amino-4,6-dideoxygalactose transaminase